MISEIPGLGTRWEPCFGVLDFHSLQLDSPEKVQTRSLPEWPSPKAVPPLYWGKRTHNKNQGGGSPKQNPFVGGTLTQNDRPFKPTRTQRQKKKRTRNPETRRDPPRPAGFPFVQGSRAGRKKRRRLQAPHKKPPQCWHHLGSVQLLSSSSHGMRGGAKSSRRGSGPVQALLSWFNIFSNDHGEWFNIPK